MSETVPDKTADLKRQARDLVHKLTVVTQGAFPKWRTSRFNRRIGKLALHNNHYELQRLIDHLEDLRQVPRDLLCAAADRRDIADGKLGDPVPPVPPAKRPAQPWRGKVIPPEVDDGIVKDITAVSRVRALLDHGPSAPISLITQDMWINQWRFLKHHLDQTEKVLTALGVPVPPPPPEPRNGESREESLPGVPDGTGQG